MSDWQRSGREGDAWRYGGEERSGRDYGRERRETGTRYGEGERRSFGEREERGGQTWRGEGGYGGERRESYGPRGYGGQGWEREYGSQPYGQQYGQRSYGQQGYGGQTYGERRYGEGGFAAGNEYVRRVSDGETEQGFPGAYAGQRYGEGRHRGRGPKNYTRSDERIREDVNDRLSDDSWLDASEIEVQVSKCEVTLTGTVESREDKRRAEDIAERVSGVKNVQNNLRVQQTEAGRQAAAKAGEQVRAGYTP